MLSNQALSDQALISRLNQAQVRHLVHHNEQQWVLFEDHEYFWLTLDSVVQSVMHKAKPNQLMFGYHHALLPYLPENFDSIIELGLGAGSLIRYLYSQNPQLAYTCVEQNQQVIDWFKQYFNPHQYPVNLIAADANLVLPTLACADVLLCDLFSDFGSPAFIFASEFYQACDRAFSDTLIINLLPRNQAELDQVIRLSAAQFNQTPQLVKVAEMRNHLIIIKKQS